jgi:nitrate/TMAO reductase-like tetraheme cytochrome c subunit
MMTGQRAWFRRLSRPLKIAIQVGVLVVILSGVAGVGFLEYSAQPSFCKKCHNMEPYYDSWATSSHNDVACIECHYAPGIRAEAMGKFQAANQVVKYVTGAYGTKPWAEIEDAACLRSGCHSLRKVEGLVTYRPTPGGPAVRFNHTQHLGELRLGKQLRCTSCHSQIVQGDHLAVTPQTCNLCHFKGAQDREAGSDCVACHREPPRTVSPAGFVVDHPQYVRDLVNCRSCHEQVTDGSGAADEARCWTCHNEPARIDEFGSTELVHRVHIAEHNVECAQCHTPIEHRVVALGQSAELDCAACHSRVHEEQQRLYAGLGGHGTPSQPSSMFLARVSCQSCHQLPQGIAAHEGVQAAGEASCMSCHGVRYANILPSWQHESDRRTRQVESVVASARRAAGSASVRVRGQVDSLLGLAEENVAFVRRGKGAHNIAYADQLLRASLELTREAVESGSLPFRVPAVDLGPPISENACLQCHLGVERETVTFLGRRFDHERHTIAAGLECGTCHSSLDDHGKTLLKKTSDCASCHHPQIGAMNCAACHSGPGGAPTEPIDHPVGAFPHQPHLEAGFQCVNCHEAPSMSADGVDCTTCHALHHQPEATCVSCHQSGAKEKHALAFAHSTCSQCHGEKAQGITKWTRQVCTVCHVDRVEHNAPVACELCHEIAPIGSGESG